MSYRIAADALGMIAMQSGNEQSPVTRVLIVEDDPAITKTYMEVLSTRGREMMTAGSVAQAMDRLDEVGGDASVLVVDLGLPDGDGAEFVRQAGKKYGARPTLFISGWNDEFWDLSDAPGRWLVMQKPIPIGKLRAAVSWLLTGGPRPAELDAPD